MFFFLWMFIQIIMESLPVSSSGHVAFVAKILSKIGYGQVVSSYYPSSVIDFVFHGPTIIILMVYFFGRWWQMALHRKPNNISTFMSVSTWASLMRPALFIVVADGITILFWWLGFARSLEVKDYFLCVGFFITAFLLYLSKYFHNSKMVRWNLYDAIVLGLVQSISLLPGISRFAATFVAGRWCGYGLKDSFGLSFLISMPLIIAAFGLGVLSALKDHNLAIKLFAFKSLFVMVVAGLLGYCALYLVGKLIEKNKLWYFSSYMLLLALLSLVM